MKIKITCSCKATFEIKDGIRHPASVFCPNCGQPLPDDASQDLFAFLESFSAFESKLEHSAYEACILNE